MTDYKTSRRRRTGSSGATKRRSKRSARIFLSHSSGDKEFATMVAEFLRCSPSLVRWIDHEQIFVGDDILERLGSGLQTMDLFVFLVSEASLKSPWVDRELKFATAEEIRQNQIRILPFIIDKSEIAALPWYLQHHRAEYVTPDGQGASQILEAITKVLERRVGFLEQESVPAFRPDARIEALLKDIGQGDWKAAEHAALQILEKTDATGNNELFSALLKYQDCPDNQNSFWAAMLLIESVGDLSSHLVNRVILNKMADHKNFSVRSVAASICLRFAQYAPNIVPVDLLMKLSVYDEDWYVERPAVAALESLAHSIPSVLAVFYSRLHSSEREEREHAAQAIAEIAEKEPELLDSEGLQEQIFILNREGDIATAKRLSKALEMSRKTPRTIHYRYGL